MRFYFVLLTKILAFGISFKIITMPGAWVADKFYKLRWKKQRKSLFPRNLLEKKEDGGVV